MRERQCLVHPGVPAAAVCQSCNRALCDACWKWSVDGHPWCEGCVWRLREPGSVLVPLLGGAMGIAAAVGIVRRMGLEPMWQAGVGLGAGIAIAAIAALGAYRSQERRRARVTTPRTSDSQAELTGHPYRGALKLVARRLAPPLSGSVAVFVVVASLALAAVIAWKWARPELVLAGWWFLFGAALAHVLYHGTRIADDSTWLGLKDMPKLSGNAPDGCTGPDGCLIDEAAVLVIGLFLTVFLGWLLIELLAPAFLYVVYLTVLAALRHVANDDHRSEGRFGRALAHGFFWATLYTLPLAGVVALIKLVTNH